MKAEAIGHGVNKHLVALMVQCRATTFHVVSQLLAGGKNMLGLSHQISEIRTLLVLRIGYRAILCFERIPTESKKIVIKVKVR